MFNPKVAALFQPTVQTSEDVHSDHIFKWGVKGMKWGVRNGKKPDGTEAPSAPVKHGDKVPKATLKQIAKDLKKYSRGDIHDNPVDSAISGDGTRAAMVYPMGSVSSGGLHTNYMTSLAAKVDGVWQHKGTVASDYKDSWKGTMASRHAPSIMKKFIDGPEVTKEDKVTFAHVLKWGVKGMKWGHSKGRNSGTGYYQSHSEGMSAVLDQVKSQGYDISEDNWFRHVSGTRKPAEGQTVNFDIPMDKDGKETNKYVHIQVYNRGNMVPNNFEVNSYMDSGKPTFKEDSNG